jgi:hypothetical protein
VILFHGSHCSNALTSATSVGERFWNLKTAKSGFRGATAQSRALTARLVTKTPGQRRDKADVKINAIMMLSKPQTWGKARHAVASQVVWVEATSDAGNGASRTCFVLRGSVTLG